MKDGEPCKNNGCLKHVTYPCEGCGRVMGREVTECFAVFENGVHRGFKSKFIQKWPKCEPQMDFYFAGGSHAGYQMWLNGDNVFDDINSAKAAFSKRYVT